MASAVCCQAMSMLVPIRGRAMVRLMEVKDSDSSRACQRSDGQPAEVRGNLGLWSGQLRFGPRQEYHGESIYDLDSRF